MNIRQIRKKPPDEKKRRKAIERLRDRLGSVLLAALLSGSLLSALFLAIGISANPAAVYGASLGAAVFVALLSSSPLSALFTLLAAGLAGFVLNRFEIRPWLGARDLFRNLTAAADGDVVSVLLASPEAVAAVLCALAGALFYGMTRMQGGVYPAVALTLMAYLTGWYLGGEIAPVPLLMSLFALAALFARGHDIAVPWRRAWPTALLAAALAVAVLPPAGTTWKPMADAAQAIRDIVEEYFQFNTPRTTYSVANDGWQQMGERLGGPANPLPEDVFRAEIGEAALLRGSIKRSYTTYSWVDDGRNNRYLYLDPTKASLRAALFSSDFAAGIATQSAFSRINARVTFLKKGASSLFVPDFLESVESPIDMAVYYNDTGEVFLTRDVSAGDAYSASGLSPIHGEALRALLAETANRQDARYDAIREEYTALPDGINAGVYELARRVVSGAQNPYEAATAINEHLRSGEYAYSTNVDFPPLGVDFVSYFLLNSREGYCTYFASAMAVMARIVGLPSRYVEGYLAVPDESGVALVTGEDAHAWVEIYFRGAGWIAFDPTPGGEQTQNDGGDSHTGEPEATPEPSAQPTPDPAAPPSPSPDPTPAGGDDAPEDGAETPPPEEYADPTPPPEGEAPPPPEDDPSPESGAQSESGGNPPPAWIWKCLLALVLAAALAAFLLLRERSTRPETLSRAANDTNDTLMIWYRALLSALEARGLGCAPGETPARMAARLEEAGIGTENTAKFLQIVTVCRYGGGEPNESAIALAARAYADVCSGMKRSVKLRWLARRMLKGIGDYRAIP